MKKNTPVTHSLKILTINYKMKVTTAFSNDHGGRTNFKCLMTYVLLVFKCRLWTNAMKVTSALFLLYGIEIAILKAHLQSVICPWIFNIALLCNKQDCKHLCVHSGGIAK